MWHKGDYRVIFRYEYPHNWFQDQDVKKQMKKMVEIGEMQKASSNPVYAVCVAVLQKRITQGGLCAWATLSVGYSFCSYQDKCLFNKKQGRTFSFTRAINQVASPHREVFGEIWNENNRGASNEYI